MEGDSLIEPAARTDRFLRYDIVDSEFVESRRVDVWLPPGYDEGTDSYRVIYAQDGQNLFDATTAFVGVDWRLHDAVARLSTEETCQPAIVVGIWNTADRIAEYMPQKPLQGDRCERIRTRFAKRYGSEPMSDNYLRFMVTELKPLIDKSFRTRTSPGDTILLGSSMGALVSLYGFCEYPDVFANAVCMSTSWTIGGKSVITYLREAVPPADTRKIYFDYGSEAQIGAYEKHQHEVDRIFHRKKYVRDVNFMVQRFPGDPHSEDAWRDRVDVPLRFVLHRRGRRRHAE